MATTAAAAPAITSPKSDISNPFNDDKTDLAALLLERLDAWKHAVGYIEEYVEAHATLHKSLYKDYEKILKTVADPLREGHHFSQNHGGVATLFENIRVNTRALAENQVETEKALKGQVLQTLARLHQEIKNKHKELSGGAFKGSKAVEKCRGQTQKQIEHLGTHTSTFSAAGGKIDPDNDPYIIRRSVLHHLSKQLIEENNHRKDLLEVQNNFLIFEKHVIETLQASMQIFFQIVGAGCNDKMKMLYSDMMTTAQNIPQEFEWSNFLTQHGETLVDPKSPDRTVDMIKFANQDHGSTNAMVEGALQRKGKIMRSYNTMHFAITPAGYLHEFKEGSDFKENPEPELSLYLPECAIGSSPQDGKFNISGKDANKNKNLTQKHEFRFKANSQAEAQKWYDVASKFCTGTLTRQNSLLTSPISETAGSPTAAGALPPAYAEKHTESPPGGAKPAATPAVDTKAAAAAADTKGTAAPSTAPATAAPATTMSGAKPDAAAAKATTSEPSSAIIPDTAEKSEIHGKNPV